MNKLVRGLVVGTVVGTAVGVAMLMRDRKNVMNMQPERIKRGAVKMVRDSAKKWTSAMKSGTEAFSHKLARRIT